MSQLEDNIASDEITICFTVGPEREMEFYNAFSSMMDLDVPAKNLLLIFNPYDTKTHDRFFDLAEIRHCDIIKRKKFHSLAKCWNECIVHSKTRYSLILNDDIVFQDPMTIPKIVKKHKEGFPVVHATENWSGFSIDKALINKIGWFDENFAHSWEDADYRLRMSKNEIPYYRFDPHLVKHIRSKNGRFQNQWDKSSEYFFKKWKIQELLQERGYDIDCSQPEIRKSLLMSGLFNDSFYDNAALIYNAETLDFYPNQSKMYQEKYSK